MKGLVLIISRKGQVGPIAVVPFTPNPPRSRIVATVTETKRLTAEEFMAADLGEGIFELVRGEIVEMARPTPEHGAVCASVTGTLWTMAVSRDWDTRYLTTRPS